MKKLFYMVVCLLIVSCTTDRFNIPIKCDNAISEDGIIKNHTFDNSKPKVITYIGTIDIFNIWLKWCSSECLQRYIAQYPEFEFIFYLRVDGDLELNKALYLANRYHVSNPIYIDSDDKYRNKNIGSNCILISIITGANNKSYGCTVLGGRSTTGKFEDVIFDAIKQIKIDNNGL